MSAMLAHCEVDAGDVVGPQIGSLSDQRVRREGVDGAIASEISQLIAEAECEEVMVDPPVP
jgi:hypothetical protein